jgi:hypothetical protein
MAWVRQLNWEDGKGRAALEVGALLDVHDQDLDAELRGPRLGDVEGYSGAGQPAGCARESYGEFIAFPERLWH